MRAKSKKKSEATKKSRKVGFSLSSPQAQSVFLAGNFNQWNLSSHPLSLNNEGMWRISIPLSPGGYEYRFFVDGKWQNDPACSSVVENPFGTSNCLKIVE
jgi:1,4-alpha-glucan branching enzyme